MASSIQTSPAQETTYEAEAFECNGSNNRIKRNTKVKNGDSIRICVRPNRAARLDDVYMLKIANFAFRKNTQTAVVRQESIKDGLVGDNNRTRIACWSGSEICSFTTFLREEFFEVDGSVQGTGEVALQFGAESIRRDRNLEFSVDFEYEHEPVEIANSALRGGGRSLHGFAGWSDIAYEFDVDDGIRDADIPGLGDDGRQAIRDHWRDSPDYIKALYVLAILVILIILCCLCGACFLWRRCCADIPAYVKHSVNRVTRGAYFQDHADPPHKNRDDISETYSDEEEMAYPEHVEEDSSSEDLSDIDVKEEMLLSDKPYNESPRVDSSRMLANEPYNENNETINGNLLLTSEPHGEDEDEGSYGDDEGDGSSKPQSNRSSKKPRSSRSSKPSSRRSS